MSRYNELMKLEEVQKPIISKEIQRESVKEDKSVLIPETKTSVSKSDKTTIYEKYSLCRSFPRGNSVKHMNIHLLSIGSNNGILVLRPHHSLPPDDASTPAFMSRVFSGILMRGNNGTVPSLPLSLNVPFLQRSLPSEEDIRNRHIITAPVTVRRGPGRPFGTYCPKSTTKRKKATSTKPKAKKRKQRRTEDSDSEVASLPPLEDVSVIEDPHLADLMNVFDIGSIVDKSCCVCWRVFAVFFQT